MDNNKIIHLFITDRCDHDCALCCNKQYDIDKIPVVTVDELKYADTVCITGGEPFLIDNISFFTRDLKLQYPNVKHLYVYTSGLCFMYWVARKRTYDYALIDGINLSPKNKMDVKSIYWTLSSPVRYDEFASLKSNRLYLFPEVDASLLDSLHLEDIPNMQIIQREWQSEFTAQSGIFRRLPILF